MWKNGQSKSRLFEHVEEFSGGRRVLLISPVVLRWGEVVLMIAAGVVVGMAFWMAVFGLGFVN